MSNNNPWINHNFTIDDKWENNILGMSPPIVNDPILTNIVSNIYSGKRISNEDAVILHDMCDLPTLAIIANDLKNARHGSHVYYNRNLHVNTTNVCVLACRFCAFRRGPKSKDAYSLSKSDYIEKIQPYSEIITEVHSVGGLHNEWTIDHYEELFRTAKDKFPNISIKALTAVEIKHLSTMSNIPVTEVLIRLKDSGLDVLPGGGAEILDDDIRNIICKGKESSAEYISIHRTAHELGIPSNCTMLFGTIETTKDRINHLEKLRNLQDETRGFQCFVPYPFFADHTRLPEAELASANEILRVIAISRIMLDNIPHIKSYRMNLGDDIATLALLHGADDFDGTVGREEIMHLAGSNAELNHLDVNLTDLIISIGGIPIERNTMYSKFRSFRRDPPDDNMGLPIAYS